MNADDWEWMDSALCAQMDAGAAQRVFFGDDRGRTTADGIAYARAMCERCPVLDQCLDAVLRVASPYDTAGIVAGLLPVERADLRDDGDVRPNANEPPVWVGGRPDRERVRRRRSA